MCSWQLTIITPVFSSVLALAAANEVDNSVVGGVEQQVVKNKSISSQSSSSDNRVSVHIETAVFPAGRWDHITQYFQLTFSIHFYQLEDEVGLAILG